MKTFKPTFKPRNHTDIAKQSQYDLFYKKINSYVMDLENRGFLNDHKHEEIILMTRDLCKGLVEASTSSKIDKEINNMEKSRLDIIENKVNAQEKILRDIDLNKGNDKIFKEHVNNSLIYGFLSITILNIVGIIGYLKYLPQLL